MLSHWQLSQRFAARHVFIHGTTPFVSDEVLPPLGCGVFVSGGGRGPQRFPAAQEVHHADAERASLSQVYAPQRNKASLFSPFLKT